MISHIENINTFLKTLELCLGRVIEEVSLQGPFRDAIQTEAPFRRETDFAIRVFLPGTDNLSWLFVKESAFTENEKNLVEQVVRKLHDLYSKKQPSGKEEMVFVEDDTAPEARLLGKGVSVGFFGHL